MRNWIEKRSNTFMIKKILLVILLISGISCKKNIKSETEVYNNDFDSADLTNIIGGTLELYNGTYVLGRYNNQSFELTIKDLPKHELVEISFDLYIHDSWDGNLSGDSGRNGPDIWEFIVDGYSYINTTFSNSDCGTDTFCSPQSYPANYLNSNNNPKTGAANKFLPGVCTRAGAVGSTTLYKISKVIAHSAGSVSIRCLDRLIQTNTQSPKCDESWSIDNLKVKAINL